MRTKRRALCIVTCLALLGGVFPGITPVMAGSAPAATWAAGDTGTVTANLNAAAYGDAVSVAVGDSGTILTATGPAVWTDRTSGSETSDLYGVVCGEDTDGDTLYAAVGAGGKILTSEDGVDWSDQSVSSLTEDLRAVTYGAGTFVAVGDSGVMAVSNNGTTWRAVTSAAITTNLTGVACGRNIHGLDYFTAVGGSDIWYSLSGEVWANAINTCASLTAVAYGKDGSGNSLFAAASSAAGATRVSDSGYDDWDAVAAAPAMTAVAYGGDTFIGVNADPEIWFSADGAAWTEEAAPGTTEGLNGVAFGGGYYFAVGNNGTVVYLEASTAVDAVTLTAVSDIADNEDGSDLRVTFARAADESQITEYRILIQNDDDRNDLNLKNATLETDYTAVDPSAYPAGPVTVTLTAATLDTDGNAIDGGADYTPCYYRVYVLSVANVATLDNALSVSEDITLANTSASWKWSNGKPQGNTLGGAVYGGGRYVIVGDSGTILTSINGTSWTRCITDYSGRELYGVAYGKERYVAVGELGAVLSTDGVNWRNESGSDMNDVVYGEGLFVSTAGSGEIYTSSDGRFWTERTDVGHQLYCVDYVGGQFIAGALNGWIYTSPDGVVWTEQTSDNPNIALYGTARAAGGTYVAVGLDNGGDYTIITSADAQTWSSLTSFTNTDGFLDIVYAGNRYVAVGNSGNVYTSTDGTTWTNRTSGTDATLYGLVYGNGLYVAAGGNGEILTSSDAATWTTRSSSVTESSLNGLTYENNLFTAVGTNTILVSENGKSWREASGIPTIPLAAEGWTLFDVTMGADGGGEDLYVATGMLAADPVTAYAFLMTSPDGENWTAFTDIPAGSESLYGITYGEGRFVAVGSNGTVMYSNNGTLWLTADPGTAQDLNSVTYEASSENFVAVGSSGTIRISEDGITWSNPTTTASAETLYGVTAGDGVLMAMGNIYDVRSTDGGSNWTLKYDNTTTTMNAGTYYAGTFVGVGSNGKVYSFDSTAVWGATQEDAYLTKNVLNSVAYGNGVFAAVGDDGTILYAGTAANTAPAALSPVPTQSAVSAATTTFEASDIAEDLDGDDITIVSIDTDDSDDAVATAVLSAGVVTVTGVGAGTTGMLATVSDGTDTAIITVPLEITSGGGGGGGGSGSGGGTDTGTTSDTDYGSLTENGSSLTAEIDADKLDLRTKGTTLDISVTEEGANTITFRFTVADLQRIADNGSTLRLRTPFGIYRMPLTGLDFESIADYYPGVDFAKITVTVQIAKNSGTTAQLNGAALVGQPIDISLILTANNKKMVIDRFDEYVERDLPVADGDSFTSGVEIGDDGTVRHIPARLVTIDGKTYAAVYSRGNGISGLIRKEAGFDDMTGHWAQETVEDMVSRLIISGAGDSKFLPDEEITRAEFIAIVIRALGLSSSDSVTIADVDSDKWYYSVVAAAYSSGLVLGDANGLFRPDESITRQEAMAIVCRAMALANLDTTISEEEAAAALAAFTDADELESWAKNSAAIVIKNGIISGSNGALRPTAKISRAETAVMIRQLLTKADLI